MQSEQSSGEVTGILYTNEGRKVYKRDWLQVASKVVLSGSRPMEPEEREAVDMFFDNLGSK